MTSSRGERPCGSERGRLGPGMGAGSGGPGCVPGRLPGLGSGGKAWNVPEAGSRSERQMHSAPAHQSALFWRFLRSRRPVSEQGAGHVSAHRTHPAVHRMPAPCPPPSPSRQCQRGRRAWGPQATGLLGSGQLCLPGCPSPGSPAGVHGGPAQVPACPVDTSRSPAPVPLQGS